MLDGGCRRDHCSIALLPCPPASARASVHHPTACRRLSPPGRRSPPALRRSLGAYFSAISRRSKPSGGDSTASDLATNASGGVPAEAAAGPRGAVRVLAEVQE